jgi:hypothetical protein
MASCDICNVGISCPAGCGVFCVGGCANCLAWCEPAEVSLPDGWATLEDSAKVKLCTHEVEPDKLHRALQTLLRAPLEWTETEAADGTGDIEFFGSVGELLSHTGLRRGNGGYDSESSSP